MQETIIDLHVSLPEADASAAAQVVQTVREGGFFGYQSIDAISPDSVQFGLLAHVDYSGTDSELSFPLLDNTAANSITRAYDLDERLTALAKRLGLPCYFYEPQTDWELIVDSPTDAAGEGEQYPTGGADVADFDSGLDLDLDPSTPDEVVADRSAFIIYGKVPSPDRFVYELARDVKGPVTLVPGTQTDPAAQTDLGAPPVPSTRIAPGTPTICFAVDGTEDTAVWLDKRPVIEINESDSTLISWYTSGKKKNHATKRGTSAQGVSTRSSVAERIYDKFAPRHIWTLASEPYIPVTHVLLQNRAKLAAAHPDKSELNSVLDAQDSSLETAYVESQLDQSEDIAAAKELAAELGFVGERRDALIGALTTIDRAVQTTELVEALDLPSSTAQALAGTFNPRMLEGAVTAEKASFRAETGMHSLTERPTGNSFLDKMRQLDHDRPALALGLIVLMFLAGAGALYLGIARPSIFSNLVFTIAAYIVGIIVLLDSITSLTSWVMIRLKNRKNKDPLPK